MSLQHRNGGEIVAVTHVAHETYKGVANWFFVGHVRWRDGSESKAAQIAPHAICCEDCDKEQLNGLMSKLNQYLNEAGSWHEPKHKRDGRMYSWTPKTTEGRAQV